MILYTLSNRLPHTSSYYEHPVVQIAPFLCKSFPSLPKVSTSQFDTVSIGRHFPAISLILACHPHQKCQNQIFLLLSVLPTKKRESNFSWGENGIKINFLLAIILPVSNFHPKRVNNYKCINMLNMAEILLNFTIKMSETIYKTHLIKNLIFSIDEHNVLISHLLCLGIFLLFLFHWIINFVWFAHIKKVIKVKWLALHNKTITVCRYLYPPTVRA